MYASHWIGDYLLQILFKGMAVNKKNDSMVCMDHCFLYTLAHIPVVCYAAVVLTTDPIMILLKVILGLLFIGVTHFLQDRYWFPLKPYMEAAKKAGEWAPTLYVNIDNPYHRVCNWIAVLLVLLV
ncbi:MAG: hypothetical protein ACP5N7_06670 [Candidatus Pacearchaeota archaeon]